jgi:putative tryptophan/tyrosine transport system substrate-binding protein
MTAEHRELSVSRRQLVQAAGALGLGLLVACGRLPGQAAPESPAKIYRIGWVTPESRSPTGASPLYEALQSGLRELGYREGHNLTVDARYAEGQTERVPALVAELITLQPDVMVVIGTPMARAAQSATSTVPIVFSNVGDPVGIGLVGSYAHPDANLTGITNIAPELSGRRLQLLTEAVPGTARVAAIWNVADPSMAQEFSATQVAAEALGVDLHSIGVRERADLAGAYEAAATWGAQGIVLITDRLLTLSREPLVALSAQSGLPTISGDAGFPAASGLMAYGPDPVKQQRRAAYYVDRILKGAKPADLPVERPMTFDFVVNMKAAQAGGLTIPQHVLLQATEVIQ